MPQRNQRAHPQGSFRRRAHRLPGRSFLGEDSWVEIFHKAITVGTLFFGVWVYFNSVQPVFEKEKELQAERGRVSKLANEVAQLKLERSTLQQNLENYQADTAAHRHGIVLSYLSGIKREVQRDALAYYQLTPEAFDLRDYSLAYADAMLTRLGPVQPESPESYQKEALEFFRRFVAETIPSKATDMRWFNNLLDAYDRQEQAPEPSP